MCTDIIGLCAPWQVTESLHNILTGRAPETSYGSRDSDEQDWYTSLKHVDFRTGSYLTSQVLYANDLGKATYITIPQLRRTQFFIQTS
jgi:hypothetical protein